jgi:hypothetical protein
MGVTRILAILLIVAGITVLSYGKFSFTSTHETKLGPIAMSVDEKQTVNVPQWISIGAIVIGGLLLFAGRKG